VDVELRSTTEKDPSTNVAHLRKRRSVPAGENKGFNQVKKDENPS